MHTLKHGLVFLRKSCLLLDTVWVCCLLASAFFLHNDNLLSHQPPRTHIHQSDKMHYFPLRQTEFLLLRFQHLVCTEDTVQTLLPAEQCSRSVRWILGFIKELEMVWTIPTLGDFSIRGSEVPQSDPRGSYNCVSFTNYIQIDPCLSDNTEV